MAKMIEITSNHELDEHLSDTPERTIVVLYFYATWAIPCAQMHKILSNTKAAYARSPSYTLSILSINAEQLLDLSDRFNVTSVPFLVILKAGKVLETVSGSDNSTVRNAIERHTGKPERPNTTAAAAALPPMQKADQPAPVSNGAVKDLSGHAPSNGDPSTAPAMTSAELPEKSAASAKEELHTRLLSLVSAAPVMLFMKGTPSSPQCGFSRQLVDLLRGAGTRYGFFNILADEEVRQGMKEFADWPTFPQLWANGELVGGLDIVRFFSTSSVPSL